MEFLFLIIISSLVFLYWAFCHKNSSFLSFNKNNKFDEFDILNDILNTSKSGLYSLDKEGRFLYANDMVIQLIQHKYDTSSILGSFYTLNGEDHEIENLLQTINKDTKEYVRCVNFIDKDETIVCLEETIKPVYNSEGELLRYTGHIHDVTSFVDKSDDIARTERVIDEIVDYAKLAILMVDVSGRILKLNDYCKDLFGVEENSKAEATYLQNYIKPEQVTQLLIRLSQTIRSGSSGDSKMKFIVASGEEKEFLVKHFVLAQGQDGAHRIATVIYPANKTIDNHSTNISSILTIVSHELRTPLAGIIGSLNILKEKKIPSESSKYVLKSLQSAERLKDILKIFLQDVSGEVLINSQEFFNPYASYLNIYDIFTPSADLAGVNIDVRCCKKLPKKVYGVRRGISQALYCLFNNALGLFKNVDIVSGISCVFVDDSNIILDYYLEAKDFDFKGDRDTFLSKALIKSSNDIGADPYFEFLEGLRIGFQVKVKNISKSKITKRNSLKMVMIAEDDIYSQFIMRKQIEKKGYEVRSASDGKEALGLLEKHQFDLIFLDLQLPILSGAKVVEEFMHSDFSSYNPPIIGMSAYGDKSDFTKVENSISDFISKPIDMQRLEEIMEKYIK